MTLARGYVMTGNRLALYSLHYIHWLIESSELFSGQKIFKNVTMENFTKSANTNSLHKQYTGLCIKTNNKNSIMSKELDQLANLNSLIRP